MRCKLIDSRPRRTKWGAAAEAERRGSGAQGPLPSLRSTPVSGLLFLLARLAQQFVELLLLIRREDRLDRIHTVALPRRRGLVFRLHLFVFFMLVVVIDPEHRFLLIMGEGAGLGHFLERRQTVGAVRAARALVSFGHLGDAGIDHTGCAQGK